MMTQKVLKVGTSAAVTLSKDVLQDLHLNIGDRVVVEVDKNKRFIVIQPMTVLSKEDANVAKLTYKFIQRYRHDLEELAKK